MYNLAIEPAKQPVDFNTAMRELYAHARHRELIVHPEGVFDGQHRFSLLSSLDRHLVSRATISATPR